MKRLLIVLVCMLFVPHAAFCRTDKEPKQGQEDKSVPKVQRPREAEGKPREPKEQTWPPPFKPSEEVGADSVISFPTDI